MTHAPDTAPARLATRLSFFAAGFAMACWAPLIPFAKANVGADEAQFGVLLLCLGLGSLIAMPVTGWVAARYGARPMILLGGLGMVLSLPLLALAGQAVLLGGALLLFGAGLGTIDVAMNVHGAEVENIEARPLMSGFHAQFSIGGFAGAGGITALLSMGFSPAVAAFCGAAVTLAAVAFAGPRLLRARGGEPEPFVLPRGIVLLLAVLSAITFLIEGAVLDWSALLIVERALTSAESAGVGYMIFSIAMVVARLSGDRLKTVLGEFPILIVGGIATTLGIAIVLTAPWPPGAMAGFILIGLGAANLIPILFSIAGRQKVMPPSHAVAAVTVAGYAGILVGPALIGFAAHLTSLPTAFWLLAVLILLVPLTARVVIRA